MVIIEKRVIYYLTDVKYMSVKDTQRETGVRNLHILQSRFLQENIGIKGEI